MSEPVQSSVSWCFPLQSVKSRENEIHIWRVQVDDACFCEKCCESLLSMDEQDRASRFKFQRDRRRYIVAHAALRSILSEYLNVPPAVLQFSSGPNGKPKLAPFLGKNAVQFNLSHSHEVAVIAVSRGREIGVDVEFVKEDFPIEDVAQRIFSPKEVAVLAGLPKRLQREAFYKCWTSKEAFLKAKGTGLSGELDEVEIVLTEDEVVRVKGTIPDWALAELALTNGYVGALVMEGSECQLQRFQWQQQAPEPAHRHS